MAWTSAQPSSSCSTIIIGAPRPRSATHRLVSAKRANLSWIHLAFNRAHGCMAVGLAATPLFQGFAGEGLKKSGMSMNVRRIGYRYQRTLLRSTEVVGIGFLTGAPIRLRFIPAPPSTGVVFVRTDLQQPLAVAAHVS